MGVSIALRLLYTYIHERFSFVIALFGLGQFFEVYRTPLKYFSRYMERLVTKTLVAFAGVVGSFTGNRRRNDGVWVEGPQKEYLRSGLPDFSWHKNGGKIYQITIKYPK
jgi:hypothetical protein